MHGFGCLALGDCFWWRHVMVRAMRPKLRVLLVRFLAKVLLCPYYR
jgi:hypothetical protein